MFTTRELFPTFVDNPFLLRARSESSKMRKVFQPVSIASSLKASVNFFSELFVDHRFNLSFASTNTIKNVARLDYTVNYDIVQSCQLWHCKVQWCQQWHYQVLQCKLWYCKLWHRKWFWEENSRVPALDTRWSICNINCKNWWSKTTEINEKMPGMDPC